MRRALVVAAITIATARAAWADETPGRWASVSLGMAVTPSMGHATATPPALLAFAPELQLAWGIRLGRGGLLTTRLDLLGAMLPFAPAGLGLDVGGGWSSALDGGWGPIVRASLGGIVFGSGGEVSGPDYTAYGFRLALEAGVLHARGAFTWQILAGVQTTGLPHVEPCNPGDDCSDAGIGPTIRAEAGWLF